MLRSPGSEDGIGVMIAHARDPVVARPWSVAASVVRVHGPRVTDVQMRARCGSIKPDLTTSAPEATPINALACRTEAGVGGSPTAA